MGLDLSDDELPGLLMHSFILGEPSTENGAALYIPMSINYILSGLYRCFVLLCRSQFSGLVRPQALSLCGFFHPFFPCPILTEGKKSSSRLALHFLFFDK